MTITPNRSLQPLPMDTPLAAKPGLLDHAARNVVHAFTNCLLIPVPPGVDPDSVPAPLAPEVASDAYWSRLATDSLAVVLGCRSCGLLAIRFAGEAELQAFLQRNPESRSTLTTKHGGHPIVWHRAEVPHHALLELPGLTVQMTGNLLVLDRCGLGRTDSIVNSAAPNMENVETMDWGTSDQATVDVWLTTVLEGDLFRPGVRGGLVANRSVWRSYLVRRLRSYLAYEALERRFYIRTQADDWHPVAEDSIRPWLRELVMTAPVGTPTAKAAITDAWLDRLERRLKSLLPAGPLVLHARLKAFARDCLKVERGSDVTVGELYEAFVAWCRDNELLAMPKEVFQKNIPAVLRVEPWFRARSQSVVRETGCQNGFRSLALRRSVVVSSPMRGFVRSGAVGVRTRKTECVS